MSAEEEKRYNRQQNRKLVIKTIVSLIFMLPYLIIGFEEAHSKVKYAMEFKRNMMIVGLIGIAYWFKDEIRFLFDIYVLKQKQNQHATVPNQVQSK